MAMIEHFCVTCGTSIMDNSTQTRYCKKCGKPMSKAADEDLEQEEDYGAGIDYDDDEPDEDEDEES